MNSKVPHIEAVAAELAARIPSMAQDSAVNNAELLAGIIHELTAPLESLCVKRRTALSNVLEWAHTVEDLSEGFSDLHSRILPEVEKAINMTPSEAKALRDAQNELDAA